MRLLERTRQPIDHRDTRDPAQAPAFFDVHGGETDQVGSIRKLLLGPVTTPGALSASSLR